MVNIKVAVRIRPLSQKETAQKDEVIVKKGEKSILVTDPKVPEKQDGDSRQKIRRFAVDYCYDPQFPETCTQESVYQEVGEEVLDSVFGGYNACVLTYGHSASGKTYTMMGDLEDPGLTPRICHGLFGRMKERSSEFKVQYHTVISFLEIYNERVRDLLISDDAGQASGKFSLRVREHPKLGPYVQDLTQHVIEDEEKLLEFLALGNSRRSTAATENNVHSSRSHAVFTIRFKQNSDEDNNETDKTSKVHLVDLAGSLQDTNQQTQAKKTKSERASSSQSRTRLKEGANINKSLVTLGNVISALAESCENSGGKEHSSAKSWQPFVPYRDSVLTWLLKDTLGGNSNTIMIATISPAASCHTETINTLRYAKRTKRIVNEPVVNEDPKVRTIRELREEVSKLKNMLLSFQIENNSEQEPCGIPTGQRLTAGEQEILQRTDLHLDVTGPSEAANNNVGNSESKVKSGQKAIRRLDILPRIRSGGCESNESNASNASNAEIPEIRETTDATAFAEIHKSPPRIVIETPSSSSLTGSVSKINDEKKTDVNGLVIDRLAHERNESQVFSDSLESFSFLRSKCFTGSDCDVSELDGSEFDQRNCSYNSYNSYTDSEPKKKRFNVHKAQKAHHEHSIPKIFKASKLGGHPKKELNRKTKICLKREFSSCENLSRRDLDKMLHRSRPDLIKGISTRSQDGLPSTSSQSYTDVSGLSQSTSENSLNSSGSVDSQPSETRSAPSWSEKSSATVQPVRVRATSSKAKPGSSGRGGEAGQYKSSSRKSSVGDASDSSTPTQMLHSTPKKKDNRRSEIVAAVTTRLYATKKKPDPRLEALQTNDKDDDDEDGELEELKLCKRARMKLFDLSRKLALTKRVRKTVDNDTQTEVVVGTVRVKEKSVVTDQRGVLQFETSATNTPFDKDLKDLNGRRGEEASVIMNQVFMPHSAGNYVVECGKGVRVEVPAGVAPIPPAPSKHDLGTQTKSEKKKTTYRNQSTSPIKCKATVRATSSCQNEDSFSDDSLDLETDPVEMLEKVRPSSIKSFKCHSNDNLYREVLYIEEPLLRQVMKNPGLYRHSFDSLLDTRRQDVSDGRRIEKCALPIARYPICGTNALYEYDPNRSEPEHIIYTNLGESCRGESSIVIREKVPEIIYPQYKPKDAEERRNAAATEVQLTLFNGLPFAICTESAPYCEIVSDETIHVVRTHVRNLLSPVQRSDEAASSENSFVSNDGSDVTSSSDGSSEDFVFFETPGEREIPERPRELYTISENSEQSTSDSSPQESQGSSLTVLEKINNKRLGEEFYDRKSGEQEISRPGTWAKPEDIIYFEEPSPRPNTLFDTSTTSIPLVDPLSLSADESYGDHGDGTKGEPVTDKRTSWTGVEPLVLAGMSSGTKEEPQEMQSSPASGGQAGRSRAIGCNDGKSILEKEVTRSGGDEEKCSREGIDLLQMTITNEMHTRKEKEELLQKRKYPTNKLLNSLTVFTKQKSLIRNAKQAPGMEQPYCSLSDARNSPSSPSNTSNDDVFTNHSHSSVPNVPIDFNTPGNPSHLSSSDSASEVSISNSCNNSLQLDTTEDFFGKSDDDIEVRPSQLANKFIEETPEWRETSGRNTSERSGGEREEPSVSKVILKSVPNSKIAVAGESASKICIRLVPNGEAKSGAATDPASLQPEVSTREVGGPQMGRSADVFLINDPGTKLTPTERVGDKTGKKMNWADVQPSVQRQFLNFNILSSSRQSTFSIDSHLFGASKHTPSADASDDSITFVFLGPTGQTSVLMEIIKRSLGQASPPREVSDRALQKNSRNRGVQCNSKLMRSVSVDTAMMALSRFARNERPGMAIAKTASLDTLVPEEMQMILEQGRLHSVRESSCQCDLERPREVEKAPPLPLPGDKEPPCACRSAKSSVLRYTTSTSTTRDQETETVNERRESTTQTVKSDKMVTSSCQTSLDVDAVLVPAQDAESSSSNELESIWPCFQQTVTKPEVDRTGENEKGKKSVSWSDISCCGNLEAKDAEDSNVRGVRDDRDDSYAELSRSLPTSFQHPDVACLSKEEPGYIPRESPSPPQFELGHYRSWSPELGAETRRDHILQYEASREQPVSLDSSSQTRRVRFAEPQRWSLADLYQMMNHKATDRTEDDMSAFLKEATTLLRNLNDVSKIYEAGSKDSGAPQFTCQERSRVKTPPAATCYRRKPENPAQTEVETFYRNDCEVLVPDVSSPRRLKTLNILQERRQRKGILNLTWPRRRGTSTTGKPPTGLKCSYPPRAPRCSSHCSVVDVNPEMSRVSSSSTNWHASNLSTSFSNSYLGSSRPSSSRSVYSDYSNRPAPEEDDCVNRKQKFFPGALSPRPNVSEELQQNLEESCRRLEAAIDHDRIRQQNLANRMASLCNQRHYPKTHVDLIESDDGDDKKHVTKKLSENRRKNSTEGKESVWESSTGRDIHFRFRSCRCHCHRTVHRKKLTSFELESLTSSGRHCHVCCIPCEGDGTKRYFSAPSLSMCYDVTCRGYCPFLTGGISYLRTSPRAYMQHLLSLRRQIVDVSKTCSDLR